MYKCSECGAQYDIKPQYCDCGNDSFEEIKPEPKLEKIEENKPSLTNIKTIPSQKYEKAPAPKKIKSNFDPISITIFLLCLILSFVVIFFIGNPKETTITEDNQKKEPQTVQNTNIPTLSSFWNNSTVGVVSDKAATNNPTQTQTQTEPKPQEQPKVIVQPQIIYVHDAPRASAPKSATKTSTTQNKAVVTPAQKSQASKTANTSKPATTKTATNKTQTKPVTQKTTTQNSSNKQQNKQNTYNPFESLISKGNTSVNTNPKPQATTTQTTNKTTTTPVKTTQNTTKPAVQAPKPTTTTSQTVTLPKIDPAAARVELANYKISLRNTIGKKIDFAKVVGDGDCAITFKINSSGKLTNRAFAKQSSNITLNDAVYAAMMSTPSFSTPPAAYNNETLRLSVKFYNGNFEINLN